MSDEGDVLYKMSEEVEVYWMLKIDVERCV